MSPDVLAILTKESPGSPGAKFISDDFGLAVIGHTDSHRSTSSGRQEQSFGLSQFIFSHGRHYAKEDQESFKRPKCLL